MKKVLSIILFIFAVLGATLFTVSANNFTAENEFVIASYNGVKTFLTTDRKSDLDDSAYWICDNAKKYNIKYVSFVGDVANACKVTYTNTVAEKGMSYDDLTNLTLADKEWNKIYSSLSNTFEIFKESSIPVGISIAKDDYVSSGFNRKNLVSDYLSVETIMYEGANYKYLDDLNYYTVVENNGTKYMIFQLELFPRTAVLDWFNQAMKSNPDKYAIIYTTSFLSDSGKMYTMWDWDSGFSTSGGITTNLHSCNITWDDNPRDGEQIWKYAFSKHDNILAVISSRGWGSGITMTKIKNERGVEVAAINANAEISMNRTGPVSLFTKISADNKEITCAWAVAFEGIQGSTTIKLSKIGTLGEPLQNDELPQIAQQYNGANTAYIFGYEGNTFRPNNNMTRAEACTIFARLLLNTQTIPSGYTTKFSDVKESDWFYNAIAYLDETGFFFRNKNTTYKPNEPITRAEFVELANFASALPEKYKGVSFSDVSEDHFYKESIMAAASSGLVNGYEDGTFRPDNTITRAEVVTVINRLLGLKVNEKTVNTKALKSEFTDIKTHWARLNVLMASNSNVLSVNASDATLDGVRETSSQYTFANKHFSLSVNKKNGKVTEFINLYTGENIAISGAAPQFIFVSSSTGTKISPTKLETVGNRIKATFRNNIEVYFLVEVRDNYMTFEIDSELATGVNSVTFANISTNLPDAVNDDDYMLNGIGMSAWTNPVNKGYRESANATTAKAHSIYASGTMGAKMGIVFAKKFDSIKYLQELTDEIDPSVGLKSKAGGAYALEWEGNFGDYVIFSNLKTETIDDTVKLATELDIDQIDIHQGASSFRQGDFYFSNTKNGTAKEYYDTFGKKIADAGIETGLHTYAYYIDYDAVNILREPKWQKDLETLETYTLRGDLTKFKAQIKTVEDATDFDMTYTFFHKNSRYILIDNEIILVGQGTTSGFINVKRGQCGTKAAEHKDGATIYHLSGYFNMFAPKLGSELFYHIADLTAKAYNDGGFDMIYLDAIDGLGVHTKDGEETWYYFQMFVHRILSQCKRTPIVETSSSAPQEWNVRGRTGARDTCNRSIKKFIFSHVETNVKSIKNNMSTTLGWFSFFPDSSPVAGLKNTIQKTIFRDDMDALGTAALLYDMSMVYNSFSVAGVKDNPFHYANIMYYVNTYSKLRKSHYFTEETLEKVKAIGGEWKVIEKAPGEYAFLQMYYNQSNLGNARDVVLDTYSGDNPFEAQMPFIRIESRYSTLFENPVTLVEFDENSYIGNKEIKKSFSSDMTQNMAMSLRVCGTGKDGDAILLSFKGSTTSGESGGRADYFIDLNFTGWREIILLDMDSAEYDIEKYKFSGIDTDGSYSTYRTVANFKDMNSLTIRMTGATANNAKIGTLKAYTHTPSPIKNPTITVGSDTVTFNCTMSGGEYLEYDPLTGKAVLYHNGLLPEDQTSEEVTFTGKLNVQNGGFTAKYSATAETAAPVRARITLGFLGQEITNN